MSELTEKEAEEQGERIFKNMAMTFSMESTTKDIQEILQKKMNYNIRALKELGSILQCVSSSRKKSFGRLLTKNSSLSQFMDTVFEDSVVIVDSLNVTLQDLLKKRSLISSIE
jgi:hypothetical protein